MSQTDVRTFKAATMQEALDIVRKELGPDAVILHTRELPQPRFLKWRKTNERVEITAGTGVNVRTPKAVMALTGRPQSASSSNAALGTATYRRSEEQLAPPPPLLAPASAGANRLPQSKQPVQRSTAPMENPFPARPTPVSYHSAPIPAPVSPPGPGPVAQFAEQQTAITRQLSSIQQMVSQLTRGSLHQETEVPTELFQLYTELIDVEVEEDLARDLIHKLRECSDNEKLPDAAASKARLRAMVEADIRCAPPIGATPGRRRVVALVGPTGVGKTTTIAKLAANFRLRDGIRMGLVTVDTYRIAAVEQLRTYAEIIDLPMKVVTTPREMRRALDELAGLDLVLIDTAGRSPRDELKIQELKSLLAEAQVDEVHLVLSLAASPKSLQATAEKFAAAGTTSMILTKLDEAVGMGSLVSVSRRIPLPISYLTTGQDVPDDIEHAGAKRIARLALGEESLFGRRRREEASTK
ncbi:MAG TPA: flagellar biosynthesis protein FlhF [Planctomycetaceae bacterium]|jgi:flagellar biosynthesis protein FlhF